VKRIGAVVLLLVAGALAGGAQELVLPNRPASLKFAAIGDNGTGKSTLLEAAEILRQAASPRLFVENVLGAHGGFRSF